MEFKKGQRVIYKPNMLGKIISHGLIGRTGTVCADSGAGSAVTVRWDRDTWEHRGLLAENLEPIVLNVGDKVRIARKGESRAFGFANSWMAEMDDYVGKDKVWDVAVIDSYGVLLSYKESHSPYRFPPGSLDVVKEESAEKFFTSVEAAVAFLQKHGEVRYTPNYKPVAVQLNAEYTAYVHRDHVKVGCQNIPFGAVESLMKAIKEVPVTI